MKLYGRAIGKIIGFSAIIGLGLVTLYYISWQQGGLPGLDIFNDPFDTANRSDRIAEVPAEPVIVKPASAKTTAAIKPISTSKPKVKK
jgi:hypothetical protein